MSWGLSADAQQTFYKRTRERWVIVDRDYWGGRLRLQPRARLCTEERRRVEQMNGLQGRYVSGVRLTVHKHIFTHTHPPNPYSYRSHSRDLTLGVFVQYQFWRGRKLGCVWYRRQRRNRELRKHNQQLRGVAACVEATCTEEYRFRAFPG